MTTETYTSKDGRVTVRDNPFNEQYKWAIYLPNRDGFYSVPKDVLPDGQALADFIAEQLPKPRYVVHNNPAGWHVTDRAADRYAVALIASFTPYCPDARERAEQEAAELNARAVSDE